MGMFDSFLHPEKGYQKGKEQLDKYYQQAQGALDPYNQNGQNAYGGLNNAMSQLLNPEQLQNQWSQGYQESPYAKQLEAQAQEHGLNAAGSMGLMGSSSALQAIQGGTSNIFNQQRQQYLDDLMQKYQLGTGIGENIYGQGANAANAMSQNAMNQGQNSAGMAYGQQNSPGNLFGGLLGAGIGLAGSALGGPIGGALANGLSQKMGWSTGGK